MNETLMTVGTAELFGASLGAFVFAASYAFFFRWWKTAAGRALLAFVVSLVLVSVLNLVGVILGPDYAGREILRIIIYALPLFASWALVIVLWRSGRQGRPGLSLEPRERKTGSSPTVE